MANGVARAALVLAALGAAGVIGWNAATHWRPSPARYPLQGIDLGQRPPAIEWGSVRAAGADFAYLVATVGADRRDPAFETNWQALPDAGLRRGAVHVYSLCASAQAQADAFNTTVPAASDALPAAVDLSFDPDCADRPPPATLLADLRRFLDAVEGHTGKPIILRVSRGFERRYGVSTTFARPVWVEGDLLAPGYAAHPWRLWRATTFRRIDGVEGDVNWDVVAP